MIAANIFEHPWLILIFAAIGLVRWLTQKAKGSDDVSEPPPRPPSEPIPRSNPQSEEERIRRFLEALGQPRGAQPPPAVARRTTARGTLAHVPPPLRSPLPPLKTAPPPLPPEVTAAPFPPPLPVEPVSSRRARAVEPAFEVREVALQTSSEPPPAGPRAARFAGRIKLGTPQDLRAAIVLREIFGPPRSLQPLDLTSAQ